MKTLVLYFPESDSYRTYKNISESAINAILHELRFDNYKIEVLD